MNGSENSAYSGYGCMATGANGDAVGIGFGQRGQPAISFLFTLSYQRCLKDLSDLRISQPDPTRFTGLLWRTHLRMTGMVCSMYYKSSSFTDFKLSLVHIVIAMFMFSLRLTVRSQMALHVFRRDILYS